MKTENLCQLRDLKYSNPKRYRVLWKINPWRLTIFFVRRNKLIKSVDVFRHREWYRFIMCDMVNPKRDYNRKIKSRKKLIRNINDETKI